MNCNAVTTRAQDQRTRAAIAGAILWTMLLGPCTQSSAAQTFDLLHGFDSPPANPYGAVIQGSDGALYGTAQEGGTYGFGAVFTVNRDGTGFAILHSFSDADGRDPLAGVIEGSDGVLYGTTGGGGLNLAGVVFKVNKDGSGFATLHEFNHFDPAQGVQPVGGLLEASQGGALFGTTYLGGAHDGGIVFRINKDGSGFTIIHDFDKADPTDGARPGSELVEGSDDALYGMAEVGGAYGWGMVFKIAKDGTAFLNLHDFSPNDAANGALPEGKLIQGSDSILYGTTYYGGTYNSGVVFRVDKDGTGFLKLHDFNYADAANGAGPWAGVIEGSDGALYGTTRSGGEYAAGTVFKINRDGSAFMKLHDFSYGNAANSGAYAYAELIEGSDGALYGTTRFGGTYNAGLVFSLDKDGSSFKKLHNFSHGDGARSYGSLVEGSNGVLYGTTSAGGVEDWGTLFKVNRDGTAFLKLHDFPPFDAPYGGLLEASDGALYGTTYGGTVFKINNDGTGYSGVYHLSGNNGGTSYAAVIEGSDGALYSTTYYGGIYNSGVVFKVNKDGTGFLKLHDFNIFNDVDGYPYSALVEGSDGALYGTTSAVIGSVFKINPDGSGFLKIHAFDVAHGASPRAGLVEASDGVLYGTTSAGGTYDSGVVFKINKDGSGFATVHDFGGGDPLNGSKPQAALVEGPDGALYGTTAAGGAFDYGIVFRVNKDGAGFGNLHDFNYRPTVNGASPYAGLIEGSDGAFYGITLYGGPGDGGVIFRLTPALAMPLSSISDVASRKAPLEQDPRDP